MTLQSMQRSWMRANTRARASVAALASPRLTLFAFAFSFLRHPRHPRHSTVLIFSCIVCLSLGRQQRHGTRRRKPNHAHASRNGRLRRSQPLAHGCGAGGSESAARAQTQVRHPRRPQGWDDGPHTGDKRLAPPPPVLRRPHALGAVEGGVMFCVFTPPPWARRRRCVRVLRFSGESEAQAAGRR